MRDGKTRCRAKQMRLQSVTCHHDAPASKVCCPVTVVAGDTAGGPAAWLPVVCAGTAWSRLEAGVRHDRAEEPTHTSASARLAIQVVNLIQCAPTEQLQALLKCHTDSKGPALLSLLLSCLKRLQQRVGRVDAATEDAHMARLAWLSWGVAAVQVATTLLGRAAAGTLASNKAATSSSFSGGYNSSAGCGGNVVDLPTTSVSAQQRVASSMWLLLALHHRGSPAGSAGPAGCCSCRGTGRRPATGAASSLHAQTLGIRLPGKQPA